MMPSLEQRRQARAAYERICSGPPRQARIGYMFDRPGMLSATGCIWVLVMLADGASRMFGLDVYDGPTGPPDGETERDWIERIGRELSRFRAASSASSVSRNDMRKEVRPT